MNTTPLRDEIFEPDAKATDQLKRILAKPLAKQQYTIFFTPRSGSTWLNGIIEQSGSLGRAKEVFNPKFCRIHAQKLGIPNLETYIEYVRRRDNRGGVFSFEVTAHQVRRTFSNETAFFECFTVDPAFWLIRQDIVAQAVSLAKMNATLVGQSVAFSPEQRFEAEAKFTYDPQALKHCLMRILKAERQTEEWIVQWGLSPLRMSYEQIIKLTPHQILNVIARHAGLPDEPAVDITPRHEKLGTSRNTEFAQRFREEHADWLAPIEAERAEWVDKLDDVAALVCDI